MVGKTENLPIERTLFLLPQFFFYLREEKVKLTLAVQPGAITDFNKHSWAENVRTKNLLIGSPLSCKNVEYQRESLPLAPNLTPYNRLGRCIFDSNAFLLH